MKTLSLDIRSCPSSNLNHQSTFLQMKICALSPPLHQPPPCHCWDSAIIMFMRAHRLWRGSLLSSLMKKTKAGMIKKKKRVEPPHQSTSCQIALTWCWHQMAPQTPFPSATWTKTFWKSWCFLLRVSSVLDYICTLFALGVNQNLKRYFLSFLELEYVKTGVSSSQDLLSVDEVSGPNMGETLPLNERLKVFLSYINLECNSGEKIKTK